MGFIDNFIMFSMQFILCIMLLIFWIIFLVFTILLGSWIYGKFKNDYALFNVLWTVIKDPRGIFK